MTGIVNGKECSVTTPIKVLMDARAGFQAKSIKQIGGLVSIAGSVIDVDSSQVIFTIAENLWPNFCTYTLSPLVMQDNSVQAVSIELCDDGRAMVKLPKGVSTSKGTLGMSYLNYVQLEFEGATEIQPSGGWEKAPGSEPNSRVMDMEQGSKLCMLGGTLTTTWSDGQSSVITTLPAECIQDYQKDGFETVVGATVDGELQGMQQGELVEVPQEPTEEGSQPTPAPTQEPGNTIPYAMSYEL